MSLLPSSRGACGRLPQPRLGPRLDAPSRGADTNRRRSLRDARCSALETATEAQAEVLKAIEGVGGRGQSGLQPGQLTAFEAAVEALEADGGVQAPVASELLLGRWRLLFTTTPGTESPVQRTFTGVDAFQVFQDIVQDASGIGVRNVVKFGEKIGALRVEAETSTDAQPIPGFVPRQGEGMPLLGKSSNKPPKKKDMRLDFQFDRAGFRFQWPIRLQIPYPVPFRLLGDERKGWLDVTYLSPDGQFRLCRGNKGTLFVLSKLDRTPKQMLLDAINEGARDAEVLGLIDVLAEDNPTPDPAPSPVSEGKWKGLYEKQAPNANPLARLAGAFSVWQIVGDEAGPGGIQSIVDFIPFLLTLRAQGKYKARTDTRADITIDSISIKIPGKEFPVDIPNDGFGFVDYKYLDDDLKIVKGNRGGVFVAIKE